ncbi:hypothetical protein [Streptomyces sp. E1N211]|uniref:hypothetical protein n=1 Tax=Streptomyces sp. E1N211 TaxID=1851876 RepID=UPI000EF65831|nr:hypothetical protein [Streptomyces sp. E1N211]
MTDRPTCPAAPTADAVREAGRITRPERSLDGAAEVTPLVSADRDASVVAAALPSADDGSGDTDDDGGSGQGDGSAAQPAPGTPPPADEPRDPRLCLLVICLG